MTELPEWMQSQSAYLQHIIETQRQKYTTFDAKTIAKLAGVQQSSISNTISGRRSLSAESLVAVARACERNPVEPLIVLGFITEAEAQQYSAVTDIAKAVMDALNTLPVSQQRVAVATFLAMVKVAFAEAEIDVNALITASA